MKRVGGVLIVCNSLLQLVLGLTAQLVLQNVAAPCPVESPLAVALGPPVNTSGGESPGLGVGVIKTTFQCTGQQSALIRVLAVVCTCMGITSSLCCQ